VIGLGGDDYFPICSPALGGVEQNLKSSRAATGRKIDNLMQVLRSL
jgi:hypothetical protein